MMGIAVDGLAYFFGNEKYVLCNTTSPDSMSKNKSQIIAYRLIRKGLSRDECWRSYVNTHDNHAEILTKVLYMSEN